MAEIVEVFDDIKRGIGDKGFYILMGAAAIFGIYNLAKGNREDSADLASTRIVTSVASYPDAVTNANVIIDSIQNSIDYSEGQIIDAIQGGDEDLKTFLEQNFEQTNNYINDGFESQKNLLEENFDDLRGSLDETADRQTDLTGAVRDMQNSYSGSIGSATAAVKAAADAAAKAAAAANKAASAAKPVTKTSTAKKTEYYTYKTKKGMNTSTSIVDALKVSTGNYDSKETTATLKKVAAANGISNYTGTYNQNVTLLSKLKAGKLKKA